MDQRAHLLVNLVERPDSDKKSTSLSTRDSLARMASPNETMEVTITADQMSGTEAPVFEHYGIGEYSNNGRVFIDGFQIVVKLSNRELTPSEMSLLSKGLSFFLAPKEIDTFALSKVSDFVIHLRFKEYFFNDENIGGDFSSYPAFRNKSTWCTQRTRDLILETYLNMLEKKIFF